MPKGSLVIVGSGIRGIAQLTLESIMHIEQADKVFYCVADPVTAGYIKGKNKNATDLYEYYSNSKPRDETYIQMAEVMLESVRGGLNVVSVFYGHAGNFVSPTRRALTIARSEGFKATMLPGISAEDCLFADLLIDPSYPGAQTVEATDLIFRDRPLQTSSHVVIYQVGCLGQLGFNFKGIKNDKFGYLARRLENEYGPEHPVVNYKAAISPLAHATIQRYTIADLSTADALKTIDTTSTFYLPPKTLLPVSNSTLITCTDWENHAQQSLNPPLWADPSQNIPTLYGPREKDVIAKAKSHTTPAEYRPYIATPAMQETMEKLSLNPEYLSAYVSSPETFTQSIDGLLPRETTALASGNPNLIHLAMCKTNENDYQHPSVPTPIIVAIIVTATQNYENLYQSQKC